LIDTDKKSLGSRMAHFLDGDVEFDQLDGDIIGGLLEGWSDYAPEKVREKLLEAGGYDEERLGTLTVRPFDERSAYLETKAKLWNRARPKFQAAARVGSDFLVSRRRAPRALDGAAFLFSPNLVDQHVLHKDAYAIPLLLAEDEQEVEPADQLFTLAEDEAKGVPWRHNLSRFAIGYLAELGYNDMASSRHTARLIWQHALAVGYSPLYLEENGDAVRGNWPRVPLPHTKMLLEESAALGVRIAALLDIGTPLPGLDTSTISHLRAVGNPVRVDGAKLRRGDLTVDVGWASVQMREQKSGAISRIVMPGAGQVERRQRTDDERADLTPSQLSLLGDGVVDICLNGTTRWQGVPESAWNFKIGGFQVLRKWLSYREKSVLGRPMTINEARQFQSIARRLTELALAEPQLDANYRAATGSFDQDPLLDFV
jgi:hypothetical protein